MKLTEMLRRRSLLRAMAHAQMRRPILWLCRPWQADVVGRYGERLVLYHVVDEYAAYEAEFADQVGAERLRAVVAMERSLMDRADLVVVTSPALLEAKQPLNPHTVLVRNGVDYAAFTAALADTSPTPEDIAALPSPVIGVAGVINEKIDLGLVRDVARARPDWSIALIGPIMLRFSRQELAWLELRNVHFLGHKPVELLPRYVAACDVCLMPYKINEWTRHIDPLKMYEYLAAGKPVVSSDIPSARAFAPPLRMANDGPEFVRAIEAALGEAEDAQGEALRRIAAQHTWEQRVERISTHVQAALERTEQAASTG
jgi:glycosyltransferase involved in cell wall biosynthesis